MDKDFVLYKDALELRKLGFDLPCFAFYNDGGYHLMSFGESSSLREPDDFNKYTLIASKPLYQQAFRWFEKNHNIYVDRNTTTTPNEILDVVYKLKSWRFPPIEVTFENPYDAFDREKAQITCLRKLIEIVKDK